MIKHSWILSLLLVFSFFGNSLHAQYEAVGKLHNYLSFNHLKNNISNENLVANLIFEDTDGFIWLATENGLCRFDGQNTRFLTYEKNNQTLRLYDINCFFLDENKNVWIGAESGLFLFDRKRENLVDITPSFPKGHNLSITAISLWRDILWLGTREGLWTLKLADRSTPEAVPLPISRNNFPVEISGLLAGCHHRIYIGTSLHGLFALETKDEKIRPFLSSGKGIGNNVLKLEKYDKDGVLVATDKGVTLIQEHGNNLTLYDKGPVTGINTTSRGEIWCSTFGDGLFYFKNPHSSPINYKYNGNDNKTFDFINTAFVDSQDNFWIVPEKLGIRWLSHSARHITNYINFAHRDGLKNNIVKGIAIDSTGRWYIGTYDGLSIYHPLSHRFEHLSLSQTSPSANQIEETTFDAAGRLWLGTHNGLFCYNPENGSIKAIPSLKGLTIWEIQPLENGRGLWIGSNKGLSKLIFDPLEVKHHFTDRNYPQALHNEHILTLLEEADSLLWIGTNSHGLYLAREKAGALSYRHFDENSEIPVRRVLDLYRSSDHTLWAGTSNGLYERSDSGFFKRTVGLFKGSGNHIIKGIAEDAKHRLWLITHLGISVFDPFSGYSRTFNSMDGTAGDIFNLSACCFSTNGKLLAGSLTGLVSLDIDSLIKGDVRFPKTHISSISINNTPLMAGDSLGGRILTDVAPPFISQLELKHDENNISFVLEAIEINHPEQIQWAYRIDGEDAEWHFLGEGVNKLNFLNLPKGVYRLQYKSTNANGVWNDEYAEIAITILPHWSRTAWAYALYTLLAVVLFVVFFRYREHKIQVRENLAREQELHRQALRQERDRLEFFTNISHELRTPMTLISAPLEELCSKGDSLSVQQKKTYMDLIRNNVHLLNKLITQLLQFRKIQAGKARLKLNYHQLPQLIRSIVLNFKDYASHRKLSLDFIDESHLEHVVCDSDTIEKILYNLISNAIKYSKEGGNITVRLFVSSSHTGFYGISVKDSGIGIAPQQQDEIFHRFLRLGNTEGRISGIGIGLAFTKALVELHKGSIEVESELHQGSCFTVFLPMGLKVDEIALPEKEFSEPSATEAVLPLVHHPQEAHDSTSQESLLIVEDHVELQTFLSEFFGQRFHVLIANNGREGLEKAVQALPDIILTDVMMPEMDGVEMTRKIKANLLTSHIPVVMLTAKAEQNDETEGLEAGADYFLAKPFLPNQLELIIDNIHHHQKQMCLHLHERMLDQNAPQKEEEGEHDDFLKEVKDYIAQHLDAPDLSVELLAKAMNLSSMQLYRKIKTISHITPNDLIRNIRMERAVELLNRHDMNISEIAYAIGYSDPKYFSKCFKAIYGVNPSAFHQLH